MDQLTISERVKNIIRSSFPGVNLDEQLFMQLNSLSLVQFVTLLETEFEIRIIDLDIHEQNFQSIQVVENLINKYINHAQL